MLLCVKQLTAMIDGLETNCLGLYVDMTDAIVHAWGSYIFWLSHVALL